jgi:pimeloyl-ACP methyl ester carboxylesterase
MVDDIAKVPEWLDREAFPFEARFLETSFGRVHYVDEGPRDGEVVLLVHGTPSWSFEYRHLIPVLARTRRVIAVDHLGFGLSQRPEDFPYTPEAHTAVLREVIDRLQLTRFALAVHDYGGPIALPIAVAEPARISSLVLLNTWFWDLKTDGEFLRVARFAASFVGRFLYRWFNASLRLIMPSAYADRRKLTPRIHGQYLAPFRQRADRVRVLWTLARSLVTSSPSFGQIWDGRAQLQAIPSLVVWGLGDGALKPYMLERVRAALPHARVETLRGVGHWPQEEAPDEVARLLDGFLPRAASARDKLLTA